MYRRNCRKLQRKQSKLKELNWTGPFTIQSVSSSGVAVLKDRKGNVLKSKCSIGNLKLQRTRPNYLQCARDPSLNSAKAEASLTTTEQKDASTEGKRKDATDATTKKKVATTVGKGATIRNKDATNAKAKERVPTTKEKVTTIKNIDATDATTKKKVATSKERVTAIRNKDATDATTKKADATAKGKGAPKGKDIGDYGSCKTTTKTVDSREDRMDGQLKKKILEFLNCDFMSEIQASLFSKPLPSITCPSQMPSCNSDLRLSLKTTMHNEDEEAFNDIFSLISPVIKGMDVSMTTSAAMLSSAIIFTSHAYKMPLVDTMEMIKDHPRHLEHFSVRPMGKLPASKRLVIANNSLYAKDLQCLDDEKWPDDTVSWQYILTY